MDFDGIQGIMLLCAYNKEFSEDDLSDIEKHNLEIIKAHLEEF